MSAGVEVHVAVDRAASSLKQDDEEDQYHLGHVHRPIGQADILDAIMNVCEMEKSYGTMSLLAMISKHHHSIVQPRLRRLRKRIVLNLEDFLWRDKDNDVNIEIIECSRMSPMPVSVCTSDPDKVKTRIKKLQEQLRPTTIVYRGRPEESVLRMWKHLFPTVTLLTCTDPACLELEYGTRFLTSNVPSRWSDNSDWYTTFQNFMHTFVEQYAPAQIAVLGMQQVLNLRYHQRLHSPPSLAEYPCLRHHVFRGISHDGKMVVQEEVSRQSTQCDQTHVIRECVDLIPITDTKFETVHLDCYMHISANGPGLFSHQSGNVLPDGYPKMFRRIEDAALVALKDVRSRLVFSLFVLGHGSSDQDRADMVPIYSTTCGIQDSATGTRKTVVLQRSVDEDFANCRLNEGCKRCRDA